MDLKSAYNQVPGDPAQARLTTIAVWSPVRMMLELFIALCQLFGGKSPPLNFARYPAWLCEIAAVLFALPTSHCVDDMISVEPEALASSGNIAEDKSPPPADTFTVIGIQLGQPYRRGTQLCRLRPGGSSSLTSY